MVDLVQVGGWECQDRMTQVSYATANLRHGQDNTATFMTDMAIT
jgi:hypothetical protein